MQANHTPKGSILDAIRARMIKRKESVPPTLQVRINACKDVEDIKNLLFQNKGLNEASLKAIDRKISQLNSL